MNETEYIHGETKSIEDPELFERIVSACCGSDGNGRSRSAISVCLQTGATEPDGIGTRLENTCYGPVVSVSCNGEFTEIAFTFPEGADSRFRGLWNIIEEYRGKTQGTDAAGQGKVIMAAVILPVGAVGTYVMAAFNPFFYTSEASVPGGPINRIRLLYLSKNVCGWENTEALPGAGAHAEGKIAGTVAAGSARGE